MAKKPQGPNEIVATGQNWREKATKSATWHVVSISEGGLIGLSGPGPCRSYRTVQDEEFLRDWEHVTG